MQAIAAERNLKLELINIEENPELNSRYAELIPVVLVDGIEIGHLQVTQEQIESALVAPTGATAAAFFDLDNTLIRGSSLWHLGRGLVKHRFISADQIRSFFWKQLKFVVIGKEHLSDMDAIRRQSLKLIAGREVRELEAKGEAVAKELLLPKVFQQTLGIAKSHLDRGEDVWLVTASPRRLAQMLSRELGFTGAIGSEAEIIGGRYTGEMIGEVMHGAEKAVAVKRLASVRGYVLENCTAYSDSANDLPMLKSVGHAEVINADRKLRTAARKNGWRIHDFRRLGLARKHAVSALSLGIAPLLARIFRRKP